MKKILFAAAGVIAAIWAGSACAASLITIADTALQNMPSAESEVLDTAKKGWLLHGEAVEGNPQWYSVWEMQGETGSGFAYVHLLYPNSAGSAYVNAKDVMLVPDQDDALSPAEDAYTPATDSEGLVPSTSYAVWLNWLQEAGKYDFSAVFAEKEAQGHVDGAALTIRFQQLSQDEHNPWLYRVRAEAELAGSSVALSGTLTLKKAAEFNSSYDGDLQNALTGETGQTSLSEVLNGFISGDLALKADSGPEALNGIISAYFYLSGQPPRPCYNDIPVQLQNPDFRNLFFGGVWRDSSGLEKECRFAIGKL